MQIQLPASKPFKQACRHENGWSDHYGAMQTAAAFGGLTMPSRYTINGIWQHGVFGPWQHFSSHVLVYNAPGAMERPVFVARQDQADLMRQHGYKHVRAIGLPIVYVPDPQMERIPGSLLVLPTHSLTGDKQPDRADFVRYADSIKALTGSFSRITVCIHPNCRRNGLWVQEFTAPGIEIVYGAETSDANALLRMRMLFAQFESVTTNEWGSHVAYALAFGAKVSIAGLPITGDPAMHARDEMWKYDPAAMATAFSPEIAQARREFLRRLYVEPTGGLVDVEFGRWLIGAGHQVSPDEMKQILAQLIDPAPRVQSAAGSLKLNRPVLFISHEASRTGAPMFLLHFLRWLKRETTQEFEILIRRDGPLNADFAELATVRSLAWFEEDHSRFARYAFIYSNTACNGLFLEFFDPLPVPVVTHVHELDYGLDTLGARNMAQLMRQTSRFIACAQAVAGSLTRRFQVEAGRVAVHYEMFDPQQTDANIHGSCPENVRAGLGIPPAARVIAACGTVDHRKGADLFLQLAVRLKRRWDSSQPLYLLWIGKSNDPVMRQLLQHDLRKAGPGLNLIFAGEQANPHALLQLADVFCLTSREDPFPLVMLEATALGKPLVCFDGSGGASELCAQGAGTAVPYLDVEAMAECCLALLADESRRAKAGLVAAQLVRSRYVPDVVAPAMWTDLVRWSGVAQPAPQMSGRGRAEIFDTWIQDELPEAAYVAHTRKYEEARAGARRLLEAGRRQDAVQTLYRAVGPAIESKDGRLVVECLIALATDLAPLDVPKAAALLSQAERLMQNLPSSSELVRIYRRELAGLHAILTSAGNKVPRVA